MNLKNFIRIGVALLSTIALRSSANADSFEVTNVICRSGTSVHFQETVPVGYQVKLELTQDQASALSKSVKGQFKDASDLQSILKADSSKSVLFISTCDEERYYRSGKGPCPAGDQIIIIGKKI
jgi:hypothetical protein